MLRMTYALKDGQLVHVSKVESGLACGCICSSCGGKLEAKKGNIQAHHFAHYNAEECKTGYETSLHLLVKDILSETKSILLPSVFMYSSEASWEIYSSQTVQFDKVDVEVSHESFIPDVVGFVKQKKLLIEVRVSHAVDDLKKTKIEMSDISCIEIDLSSINREITRDELTVLLTSDCSKTKWIYNSLAANYRRSMLQFQEEIPLVRRGFALHAQTCPTSVRVWHGIPYANFIDDCAHCQYLREYQSGLSFDSDSSGFIHCSGRYKIGTFQDLKTALYKK